MKKYILAFVALMVLTIPAFADYRRHGHQGPSYAHRNHYHQPRVKNWVAPVIGGLAVGGLAYGAYDYYNRRPRQCWDEPILDRWNRIVGYDRFCR